MGTDMIARSAPFLFPTTYQQSNESHLYSEREILKAGIFL